MSPEKIQQMIHEVLPGSQVTMSGADCNFSVEVKATQFKGLAPIKRHRMVNEIFKGQFESGELHALSIKTSVLESN
ncbi:BolA/IbaG family iron-sulfur metabolism protein [Thiomicrospira sp. ALE5]|uniref:BolA/IbaG family iron-sulfur metabolism protein n=1 Tax=Thiomicrospira sp. ALE5 TaxID=748650 RepID=UPI0008E6A127|nr:BolA/IbaG family iron-sulfur metabolism protein [Thiomicrospira sp. ALE5]SFR59754.1 Acid stress-induced BolA-like protein IbaG/YrbA, predicted regulator of iron metabolism [Thiomicrospira sp. ALE5]